MDTLIARKIEAPSGPLASLDEELSALAECCMGFLAAYLALLAGNENERANTALWAGVLWARAGFVHEASYDA